MFPSEINFALFDHISDNLLPWTNNSRINLNAAESFVFQIELTRLYESVNICLRCYG